MGNASSSSATQQPLAVWMLARDGDSVALRAVMEQVPTELKASYLDWVDQADQRTPVAIATLLGHVDCVKLLLKAAADGNRVGRDGMGPLHLAVKADNLEITTVLLESAQVDCNVVDARGHTPLLVAAADGRTRVVNLLLRFDRVDLFCRHEKSGLDVIEVARKALKRATATDRLRVKECLELVETRLLIRAGYVFEYCKTGVHSESHAFTKYFELKGTSDWSWQRRNYQVFRTADPESARVRFYHIGSENPSVEFTLKDVRKSVGWYRYPASIRERARTFALHGIPTSKHSTVQVFECAASTTADMEFWRHLPSTLQASSLRPSERERRIVSELDHAAVELHPEPVLWQENPPQDGSENRHLQEWTKETQDTDRISSPPAKTLVDYEAHPSTSTSKATNAMEDPSPAKPATSSQSSDCIICFDAAQIVACIPCGHIAMCLNCAQQVQSTIRVCPVCRSSVYDVMKIFQT